MNARYHAIHEFRKTVGSNLNPVTKLGEPGTEEELKRIIENLDFTEMSLLRFAYAINADIFVLRKLVEEKH